MTAYEVTAVLSAHAHLVDAQPAEGEAAHEAGEDAHGEGVGRREHRARLLGREPRELEEPRGHTLRLRLLLRIRRAGATRRALGRHARHCRLPFAHGRPDCVRAIDDVARGGAARPHVFVCGPPGLSAACSAACLDRGVDFHSEVFAF